MRSDARTLKKRWIRTRLERVASRVTVLFLRLRGYTSSPACICQALQGERDCAKIEVL